MFQLSLLTICCYILLDVIIIIDPFPAVVDKDVESSNTKKRLTNQVKQLLDSIYITIKTFSTQQKLADEVKVLKEAKTKILDPEIKISQLIPLSTNLNRKGRKSKRGVKSNTTRLQTAIEKLEER